MIKYIALVLMTSSFVHSMEPPKYESIVEPESTEYPRVTNNRPTRLQETFLAQLRSTSDNVHYVKNAILALPNFHFSEELRKEKKDKSTEEE